ncbi:MAG: hypothetical protein A2176_03605 [Spirochaetes bacterium RBG_13_51_14]|nr:MAG: hypothetical protein A2176_03605 [Spirochaetes bacterium RBG_13_51_14]
MGNKTIYTDIIIHSPVDHVWEKFMNFPDYPRWNPFILKVNGEIKTGNTIEVVIKPKDREPMTFKPTIQAIEERALLQWDGKLFVPGIFTGKHTFEFITIDKNNTKFIHKEEFNGILVPFIDLTPTRLGFESMNIALKYVVEKNNSKQLSSP